MESEECPENFVQEKNSGLLKSLTIYLVIFVFGFLAASFWSGAKDSVKGTANLAVNTAKETFAIPRGGAGEFVPLKSDSAKTVISKTSTVSRPKPSLPVVVREEKASEIFAVAPATNTDPIVSDANISVVVPTSSFFVSPVATSSNNSPVTSSETSQTNDIKFSPLIYEIRITGGAGKSAEDYIKIFNPNPKTVDLSGWKLRKRTQSGSESSIRVFPDGTSVGAGKLLIWANNGYASVVGAELMSSQTLAANNSVGLLNKDGVLIDAVGWGEIGSVGFVEGSAYPANPEEGQVLLRRQSGGLLVDTQNNAADFEIY